MSFVVGICTYLAGSVVVFAFKGDFVPWLIFSAVFLVLFGVACATEMKKNELP